MTYEEAVNAARSQAQGKGWGKEVYRYGGCATLGYGVLIEAGLLGVITFTIDEDEEPYRHNFCFPIASGSEFRAKIEKLLEQERTRPNPGYHPNAPDIEKLLEKDWAQA